MASSMHYCIDQLDEKNYSLLSFIVKHLMCIYKLYMYEDRILKYPYKY